MPTLDWIGKKAVVNHHQDVPYHLLRDVPALGCGPADSGNLIVEGDNLTALKALLPYYAGQVKCIYIDPPYNTGNEGWVYNDNVNSPEINAWLGKVVGKEAEDLSRHDKWLCMMYPRLKLLREFLREDGTIFVSLDDNEIHSLRLIMDEIFGAPNFLGMVIWEKSDSPRMDARFYSNRHDFIATYARNHEHASFNRLKLGEDNTPEHYDKIDDQGRRFYLKPLRAMGGEGDSREARPTLHYALTAPDGTLVYPKKQDGTDGAWRWNQDKCVKDADRIEWKNGRKGWAPYYRIYAEGTGRPAETIWFHGEVGSNRTSKIELTAIFPSEAAFATPKPTRLIERVLEIASNPGDLVMDSFAGSGTTAHAVLKLNAAESKKTPRRFLLAEVDPKIAKEITAERVKRVATGYTNAKGEKVEGLGGGFRYVQLGEPLFESTGKIRGTVRFRDLARHVFFTETGTPLPHDAPCDKPLLGVAHGTGVYLLYNGILKDKSVDGGNVLTAPILDGLPQHDGPKVIYAVASRVSPQRLKSLGITFKQTPYAIKVR